MLIPLSLLAVCSARLSRLRDITPVGGGASDGTDANGFPIVNVTNPTGNPMPPGSTTPSPYQTYSASWPNNMTIVWQPDPNAFTFDTSNIANLQLDNLGANFAVLRTAGLTYSR